MNRMVPDGNELKLMDVACSRYKVLARQYKSMYPTLEIDIEGELDKLKVIKTTRKTFLEALNCRLCSNMLGDLCRTTWSGSSPW